MKSVQKRLSEAFGPHTRGRNLLITVLLVLCAVEVNSLAHDARVAAYQVSDGFPGTQGVFHHLDDHNPDVNDIDTWMTFDYLNTVFKLPPKYLQHALAITDPSYPNIHIGRFAKDSHQTLAAALAQVRAAIQAYGSGTAAR